MIGRKFGRLTVIERVKNHITTGGQSKVTWLCECECGNKITVASQDLKSGHTKSCGCMPKVYKGMGLIDLVGQRFGKLTVLERAEDYSYKSKGKINNVPAWLCQCDCGNKIIAQGGNLRNGLVKHCGCERIFSKGEKIVSDFLTSNNIKFQPEYIFDDLINKSGHHLRFDFGILNDNENPIMVVEYQGKQHYDDRTEFGLYQRKYSDPAKRNYCKINNIPLFEIRYDEDIDVALNNLLNEINKY